ncbi:glycosyltransferase family 4 protein [Candidatus Nomurabacteria bacterium]|nr:MAG: glycosyltransferase family 4 protein [Candidatus Nomurabacteria bacterium]
MKILILAYDWRGFSLHDSKEVLRRLNRDGFDPENNVIHFLQVGPVSGDKVISKNVTSKVIKFPFQHARPLSDFFLGIVAIIFIVKRKFIPDLVVAADAALLWWVNFFKKERFQVCIFINGLNRVWAKKTGSKARYWYVVLSELVVRRRIDHAMTISRDSFEYAKNYLKIKEESIHSFTPQTFEHIPEFSKLKSVEIKRQLGISDESMTLLTVSRLEKEKGIDLLIEAFSTQDTRAHLVIVGEGSMMKELKDRCKELNIHDRVHFVGAVNHDAVWSYYYFADLYIQPSRSEALGLSLLEAMLCGVLVGAFPVGGLRDSIGEQLNRGWFFDEHNFSQSLKEIVERIKNKDGNVGDVVARAKMYVHEKIKQAPKIQSFISI